MHRGDGFDFTKALKVRVRSIGAPHQSLPEQRESLFRTRSSVDRTTIAGRDPPSVSTTDRHAMPHPALLSSTLANKVGAVVDVQVRNEALVLRAKGRWELDEDERGGSG